MPVNPTRFCSTVVQPLIFCGRSVAGRGALLAAKYHRFAWPPILARWRRLHVHRVCRWPADFRTSPADRLLPIVTCTCAFWVPCDAGPPHAPTLAPFRSTGPAPADCRTALSKYRIRQKLARIWRLHRHSRPSTLRLRPVLCSPAQLQQPSSILGRAEWWLAASGFKNMLPLKMTLRNCRSVREMRGPTIFVPGTLHLPRQIFAVR